MAGGGLISGIAAAAAALLPNARVNGVEPELAADAADSLHTGALRVWGAEETARTIADGLRTASLGEMAWPHVKAYVHDILTVTEDKIEDATKPNGHRPGYDSGDPQTFKLTFDTAPLIKTGVWECKPGGWDVTPRGDTEVCYILNGRAHITCHETGRRFEITGGDVIVQPKGWTGRWEVTETIRKFACDGFD